MSARTALFCPLALLTLLLACGDKDGDGGGKDSGGGEATEDADDDGYSADVDCDDADATVGAGSSFYVDLDSDGYGEESSETRACEAPADHVALGGDCDDANAAVNPGAAEVCDDADVDEDCNGFADDEDTSVDPDSLGVFYTDSDDDGYGSVAAGVVLACETPAEAAADANDCNDADGTINPDAGEICDGVDNDCDGLADAADLDLVDGMAAYIDRDGDGFGDPDTEEVVCTLDPLQVAIGEDCDDTAVLVNPDATEICDEDDVDEDCNSLADDDDTGVDLVNSGTTWYLDLDEDGYGDIQDAGLRACNDPSDTRYAYATVQGDCQDLVVEVNPGETEVCNDAIDNDCSGDAPECRNVGIVTETDLSMMFTGPSGEDFGYDFTVGDFNGDGSSDLAAAARYEEAVSGQYSNGEVYVYYGPLTAGLDYTAASASFVGEGSYYYAGEAMTSGDMNNDGVDDLIVGVNGDDAMASSAGAVYVIFGSTTAWTTMQAPISSEADVAWLGATSSDYLGEATRMVGDVTGDGYADLLMGASSDNYAGTSSGSGSVFLVAGPLSSRGTAGIYTEADAILYGTASSDNLGDLRSIAGPFDADGDGVNEVLTSATYVDSGGNYSVGAAYLIYGSTALATLGAADISTAADAIYMGTIEYEYLGDGVEGVGDVNGDGYDDFAMGGDGYDSSSATSTGAVWLYYGGATRESGTNVAATTADASFIGVDSSDYLGNAIAGGDHDGDGVSDMVIGANGADAVQSSGGSAYLFYGPVSGTNVATSAAFIVNGASTTYSYLGQTIHAADLNDDGFDDFLIGAYGADYLVIELGLGM